MERYTDFKSMVESHQEKVRNTCFRFVNNREDADDVAQEVFIQVYKSLAHFRQEAQISTWIYRIAINKSLDFIRKKSVKNDSHNLLHCLALGKKREKSASRPTAIPI
jgi:RNA polymerase sigma-70 factor (ECF subfamily)